VPALGATVSALSAAMSVPACFARPQHSSARPGVASPRTPARPSRLAWCPANVPVASTVCMVHILVSLLKLGVTPSFGEQVADSHQSLLLDSTIMIKDLYNLFNSR
jgi:hypothetical protein